MMLHFETEDVYTINKALKLLAGVSVYSKETRQRAENLHSYLNQFLEGESEK